MKRITLLLVALFLILFETIPEGLALGGHKTIAGVFEFIYLAGITFSVFAYFTVYYPQGQSIYHTELGHIQGTLMFTPKSIWYTLLGYIFLRFALFDGIHNLCAGLPFFYIGTTKLIDQAWQWFFTLTKFPEEAWLGSWKLILGLIGVTFLVRK